MLRHVVMWDVKAGVGGRDKQESMDFIKFKLEELIDMIDEIKSIEVGINVLESKGSKDIVLDATFENLEDLKVYANHPEHLRVTDEIKEMLLDRRAVDFEF